MKTNASQLFRSPLLLVAVIVVCIVLMNVLGFGPPPVAPEAQPAAAELAAEPAPQPEDDAALLARGLELYAANCAACHGDTGAGDGTAAYLLYPKPRNFAEGQFRVTSTKSGLPSDADLLEVLRRGMPGSSMPSWGHLPERDLRAMVRAVRELAIRGKAAQLQQSSRSMKPDRALKLAHDLLDSGPPFELPAPVPADKLDLARGEALYIDNCVACHDVDGRGRNKRDLTDNSGQPIFARDFTAGIFKGGSDARSLALRIARGMPGTPMPAAADMPPEDLWSLVAYVQTFIQPGAQERVEQVQKNLLAGRVNAPLTNDPDDPVWKSAQATFLPLMPLWWRDQRVEGVTVQALHDGKQIAIRVEWRDATGDELTIHPQDFTDGVAIQLSGDANPPLFAMGQPGVNVDIWHWKASRQRLNSQQPPSLTDRYPNMPQDDWGEPTDAVYHPSIAAGNIVAPTSGAESVECLVAGGFGTLTSRGPDAQKARGGARRSPDGWRVVFLHDLGAHGHGATDPSGEVALEPGGSVNIALAVWDGSSQDRNGQKSVTIWHRFAIER